MFSARPVTVSVVSPTLKWTVTGMDPSQSFLLLFVAFFFEVGVALGWPGWFVYKEHHHHHHLQLLVFHRQAECFLPLFRAGIHVHPVQHQTNFQGAHKKR